MRLCLIEISNTRTKIASCHDGSIGEVWTAASADLDAVQLEKMAAGRYDGYVCSSVVPRLTQIIRDLMLPRCLMIDATISLGFSFDYPRPEEIGIDRLANAAGLVAFHGVPGIAIDIGTAATFEVVDEARRFVGGCIAPGPDLLLASLHQHTAQLPRTGVGEWALPAKSTGEAMRAGCQAGYPAMLDSLLEQMLESLRWNDRPPTIVVTGGHAAGFLAQSGQKMVHDPHLTLRGLWRAAELNPTLFTS